MVGCNCASNLYIRGSKWYASAYVRCSSICQGASACLSDQSRPAYRAHPEPGAQWLLQARLPVRDATTERGYGLMIVGVIRSLRHFGGVERTAREQRLIRRFGGFVQRMATYLVMSDGL